MLRNKPFVIFLSLALVFSFLAANAIFFAIRTYVPAARYDDPVTVVVAGSEIRPFAPISADQLQLREIPRGLAHRDVLTDVMQVAGKSSRTLLLAGDIIRGGHLTSAAGTENETVSRLSALGDPAKRAVLLPLPKGLTLAAGDRVNVIHVSGTREAAESRTILENVLVLSAKEETAFLALRQADAERLVRAMNTGQITYTLSPVGVPFTGVMSAWPH
jgi:Flp pilus assembly protein CpaB